MRGEDFLSLVYQRFVADGAWPTVRSLQVELRREGDVRLLAASAGRELVVCAYGSDPVCYLTLAGLNTLPQASEDVAHVVGCFRWMAKSFITQGATVLRSSAIAEALGLSEDSLTRLGLILYHDQEAWAGWGASGAQFEITPRDDILFFENVTSLPDVLAVRKRRREESMEVARQSQRYPRHIAAESSKSAEAGSVAVSNSSPPKSALVLFLEGERHKRGVLWAVAATLVGLVLTLLSL